MPVNYDDPELSKALGKLEAKLSEDEKPEPAEDVLKSLADVAKGALEIATTRTQKKRAKAEAVALAKAEEIEKAKKKEDDEDPEWLKKMTDDGKSEGEMIMAPDREHMNMHQMTNAGGESRSMTKSVKVDEVAVVDVEPYLTKSLAVQEETSRAVHQQRQLNKGMLDGLVDMSKTLAHLEAQQDYAMRCLATLAKAMTSLLEDREAVVTTPKDSQFARMEKSAPVLARQALIDAQGGTLFSMDQGTPLGKSNAARLFRAALQRKISPELQLEIKRTERLPAGVSLD